MPEAQACPYLLDLEPTDLKGPMAQLQAKRANREGTLELVRDINKALGEEKLESETLLKVFDRSWKEIEEKFASIPPVQMPEPKREVDDMVREILDIVRKDRRNRVVVKRIDPRPARDIPPAGDVASAQIIDLFEALKKTLSETPQHTPDPNNPRTK
jgi:hypothetical protein